MVDRPVREIVEVERPVIQEKLVSVEKIVEVPVEKVEIKQIRVEVPIHTVEIREVEKIVQVPVEKIVL